VSYTLEERRRVEEQVRELIDRGFTISEIARELDRSRQAVSQFIRRRGWEVARSPQAPGARQKEPPA